MRKKLPNISDNPVANKPGQSPPKKQLSTSGKTKKNNGNFPPKSGSTAQRTAAIKKTLSIVRPYCCVRVNENMRVWELFI
jgi:hypothetical protein